MSKIRVLIVDDSPVVQKLISVALTSDPEIEVAGTAKNGKIALEQIRALDPDFVTLDVEMPVMNGLEALAKIRKAHRDLPVVMFSTVTERGAVSTLDALALGANHYVTKPSGKGGREAATQAVKDELLPLIHALAGRRKLVESMPARSAPSKPRTDSPEIIAIAVSTGGPNALTELIPALPQDLKAPVVVVQHMPALFTHLLAERLDKQSGIKVAEAEDGMPLEAGQVLIAPGGRHMTVDLSGSEGRIVLNDDPPENSCKPAADVLFRSVAQAYGSRALGIVLTGMGSDGLKGCEQISRAGGEVLVQDEASSVVWGMPGAIVEADLSDEVLDLREIAPAIVQRMG